MLSEEMKRDFDALEAEFTGLEGAFALLQARVVELEATTGRKDEIYYQGILEKKLGAKHLHLPGVCYTDLTTDDAHMKEWSDYHVLPGQVEGGMDYGNYAVERGFSLAVNGSMVTFKNASYAAPAYKAPLRPQMVSSGKQTGGALQHPVVIGFAVFCLYQWSLDSENRAETQRKTSGRSAAKRPSQEAVTNAATSTLTESRFVNKSPGTPLPRLGQI
ncbi:hypothetical protein HK097_010067 [Rhizophlyctis rosea]|uniref:Uncharacterized protein n=1 Tax=Rhizophlyctis rosea TaxID=64517 RepID=A0AAD5S805_9FUNG|nr:hypothetical protein HK097_010067 [Rhizophlyctis rosea]